jgi:hypothetical protein
MMCELDDAASQSELVAGIGGKRTGLESESHSDIVKVTHPEIMSCTSMRDTVCLDPT